MRRRLLLIGLLTAGAAGAPAASVRAQVVPSTGVPATTSTPSVTTPPSAATPATESVPGSTDSTPSASAGGQQAQKTVGKTLRKATGEDAQSKKDKADHQPEATTIRQGDGIPTAANPTISQALPGAAAIGVPNFFIDKFRIPPFLLPIYQAAGIEYGVRWEVLAGINEIETDYGRNLNVSTAGALGWMQFMPSTWKQYGVDANHDGKKDPYNPVDAIFAAARYLKAAGADTDVRKAIFSYNHADWYVDSVLMRARLIDGLSAELVGSLTGLTEGRFPVVAKATYVDTAKLRGTEVYARAGAPVIAIQDARVVRTGATARLGRFVQLRDVYGNTYTYARLAVIGRETRRARSAVVAGAPAKERVFAHPSGVARRSWERGAKVAAGTVVGRIGAAGGPPRDAHLLFEIRPAGKGAPRVDPKPILDGWKLLESTAIYRAAGKNPFFGPDAKNPSIGQVLLMSKESLQKRVLDDPRISVYDCGRRDIKAGNIDRRVLATLEFLASSGLKPTVSALECGHSLMTTSGNVSEHSSGSAVDIAAINGIPILGHQGEGSITDMTIRRLLTLQGTMKPHQIISLMTFDGADNTLALPDHNDHIHVGFRATRPTVDVGSWSRLMRRLGQIDNPVLAEPPQTGS